MLTTEFTSVQMPFAKLKPQYFFWRRRLVAKCDCSLADDFRIHGGGLFVGGLYDELGVVNFLVFCGWIVVCWRCGGRPPPRPSPFQGEGGLLYSPHPGPPPSRGRGIYIYIQKNTPITRCFLSKSYLVISRIFSTTCSKATWVLIIYATAPKSIARLMSSCSAKLVSAITAGASGCSRS